MPVDIPEEWDDAGSDTETVDVDFDVDPLVIHTEDTSDDTDDGPTDAPDPDLDNLLVEFVDLFNARDLDSLAELFASDAEAGFLHESTGPEVVAGLEDFIFRRPDVLVTRGDLGPAPVAAVWILDADSDQYRMCGYFEIELAETDTALIGQLDLIEDVPEDGLVVETPDISERPEWEDWAAQDET